MAVQFYVINVTLERGNNPFRPMSQTVYLGHETDSANTCDQRAGWNLDTFRRFRTGEFRRLQCIFFGLCLLASLPD
jgi:hypothetical protein